MKIVADENMPKVAEIFGDIAQIHYVDGRSLRSEQVKDADALLVRSVTPVNQALLQGSNVKFVGTATIGTDHIDTQYLQQQGIAFASAPGCNADAVADYVMSSLGFLYEHKGVHWLKATIGLVGYGNVGSTVYDRLKALGCFLKVYDPLKEQSLKGTPSSESINFASLEEVVSCDIVLFHAPLTKTGPYPTQGMVNSEVLVNLKENACIINAGRGGVIDELALQQRYQELGGQISLVMDVWEGEPNIHLSTMNIADIATPHIAGYSLQGRERGTWMVYQALCQHYGITALSSKDVLSNGAIDSLTLSDLSSTKAVQATDLHKQLARACHAIYDVSRDDAIMRRQLLHPTNPKSFDFLRKHYVHRDEYSTCSVQASQNSEAFSAIGFA